MGGYAWFLWPAYAITFVVLIGNIWLARQSHVKARREAQRRLQMSEGDEV
jgi:heme exporter protein CcmD